jgi:DNA-binding MarR family transcriptional regulator
VMTQLEITTKILRNLPKDLTASEQITLLVISTFINLERDKCARCWPTNSLLAAQTGLSERAIIRALVRLEAMGLIERQTKFDPDANKRTRILILNLDKLTPVSAAQEVKEDAWEDDLDDW